MSDYTVGRARTVSTEIKAAFLCGLFSGSNWSQSSRAKAFREEMRPHAETAARIAFGDGAFNPLDVWDMERFYDQVVDNCENGRGYER